MGNPLAAAVEARGLVKKYPDLVAVQGIDFAIEAGECFGFLGPNGAGKTSTLRMIGCVSPLSGGELYVLGRDVRRESRAIKARLGVVPQKENLDPDLTVWQNLMVYARYFDLPQPLAQRRAQDALELFHLLDRRTSPIATLSDGMKKRLLIARALLNQPHLLILDEPTTGLDPQARLLVWQKLEYLKGQGTTLILSTHNMEEAARLCNRLVIMHLGRILAQGAPAELVRQYAGEEVLEMRLAPEDKPALMEKLNSRHFGVSEVGDTLYLFGPDVGTLPAVLGLGGVFSRRATLEDVFLRLTGRGLEG